MAFKVRKFRDVWIVCRKGEQTSYSRQRHRGTQENILQQSVFCLQGSLQLCEARRLNTRMEGFGRLITWGTADLDKPTSGTRVYRQG